MLPGSMKRPKAASSKKDEDDGTLVRRKAQEAEEKVRAFAYKLRLQKPRENLN